MFAVSGVIFDGIGTASAASTSVTIDDNSEEVAVTSYTFGINGVEKDSITVSGQTAFSTTPTSHQSQSRSNSAQFSVTALDDIDELGSTQILTSVSEDITKQVVTGTYRPNTNFLIPRETFFHTGVSGPATLWIAQDDSYTQDSVTSVSSETDAGEYPDPENGSALLVGDDETIWDVNIASGPDTGQAPVGSQSPNDSSEGLTATILSGDSPLLLMMSGILGVAVLGGASVVRRTQSLPRATNVGVGITAVVFVLLFSWWARNVGSLPLTVLTTSLVSVVVAAGWSRLRTTSIAKDDIGAAIISFIG
ncbi:MAG: hypothetical protein J07HQX50_01753, partial [Haloquadratum sp. J07HQX50]